MIRRSSGSVKSISRREDDRPPPSKMEAFKHVQPRWRAEYPEDPGRKDGGLGKAMVDYHVVSTTFALPAQICYKRAIVSDHTDRRTDQTTNRNLDSARFGPIRA